MKTLLTLLLSVLLTIYGYSQKIDATKVPQVVKNAFTKTHPDAAPTWEKEGVNYEANFKEGGQAMSCIIDKQGIVFETESSIPASELPAAATTYMNQHYKGKKWKEVAKIVKANGEVNFEVNAGTDVLFDASGNHLEKPKTKKEKD